MAGFTDAVENTILDHVFRNQAYSPPATVYVGYSSNGTTECTDANYVRQSITFGAAAAGAIANTGAVTFPAAAAGHDVHSCALFTAETDGTQMTDWKALTGGTVSLLVDQQFRIPVGDYDVTLD